MLKKLAVISALGLNIGLLLYAQQGNPDGSISKNENLGGSDHTGDCTHTFSITPSPILTIQGQPTIVTFNVGYLGGPQVVDKDSLLPQSLPDFNIQSGGSVQWESGGPPEGVPTAVGSDHNSRLTTQHPTMTHTYPQAGCNVITATMAGDFKRNTGGSGSYRCRITQTAIVEIALPGTTIHCTGGKPSYTYTVKAGDTISKIVHNVGGKPGYSKKLRGANKVKLQGKTINQPLKVGVVLEVPDPTAPATP